MLEFLPALPRAVVAFVVVLGILVFIHELGHYLGARWRQVHVETFSIGFGHALFSWKDSRGTVWKICWVPLGGYVRLHGHERPEDAAPEVRASWRPGQTFNEKSVLSRSIVIAAGPLANFALAAALFFVLYATLGRPLLQPVVGEVRPDSAAAHAGLLTGDRILAIDARPIAKFEELQRIVQANPGKQLILHVMRQDSPRDIPIVPEEQLDARGARSGKLGISSGATVFEPITIPAAAIAGVAQTWDVVVQTLDGVWGMITRRNTGEDFGGPLRIAQLSGQVATLGLASAVSFIALLSVNLGLINLFPIPVLDGGHLMFLLAEALRGKPLPPRAQEYGFRAGFALLIGLFVFATFKDLGHIGVLHWFRSLIG